MSIETTTYVKHCQYAISQIKALQEPNDAVDEDGTFDCDFYEHYYTQTVQTILDLIDENTNPTLPSFLTMCRMAIDFKLITTDVTRHLEIV